METKKYTTHSSFWWNVVLFILWATSLSLTIIWKRPVVLIIIFSLNVVLYLVMAIRCGLAWHAYVEISEEGVKMKGCAKRISEHKKEIIDDMFIPWEDIEKINVWDNIWDGALLILNTGEKIKLTQQININSKILRKAFEQYKPKFKPKPKPKQTQEPFEVVGVFGQDSGSTSSNEYTDGIII